MDFKTRLHYSSSQDVFSLLPPPIIIITLNTSWACKLAVCVNRAGADRRTGEMVTGRAALGWHRGVAGGRLCSQLKPIFHAGERRMPLLQKGWQRQCFLTGVGDRLQREAQTPRVEAQWRLGAGTDL